MKYFGLILLGLIVGIVSITVVQAQSQSDGFCPIAVEEALSQVDQSCGRLGRNRACYGERNVLAEFVESDEPPTFQQPADIASLGELRTVSTTPYDPVTNEVGVVVMSVQANVPNTLPGQGVIYLLIGDGTIANEAAPAGDLLDAQVTTNANVRSGPGTQFNVLRSTDPGAAVQVDATSLDGEWLRENDGLNFGWIFRDLVDGPSAVADLPAIERNAPSAFQAFTFRTGVGQPQCDQAPTALVVQTPRNNEVTLTVSGTDLIIGSTIVFDFDADGNLQASVLDGTITLPNGERLVAGMASMFDPATMSWGPAFPADVMRYGVLPAIPGSLMNYDVETPDDAVVALIAELYADGEISAEDLAQVEQLIAEIEAAAGEIVDQPSTPPSQNNTTVVVVNADQQIANDTANPGDFQSDTSNWCDAGNVWGPRLCNSGEIGPPEWAYEAGWWFQRVSEGDIAPEDVPSVIGDPEQFPFSIAVTSDSSGGGGGSTRVVTPSGRVYVIVLTGASGGNPSPNAPTDPDLFIAEDGFTATISDAAEIEDMFFGGDPNAVISAEELGLPSDSEFVIWGNDNANYIVGSEGDDTIYGEGGNDVLIGDSVDGSGNSGDDNLFGGDDDDTLYGDSISGSDNTGADDISGGDGFDTAEGPGGDVDTVQPDVEQDNSFADAGGASSLDADVVSVSAPEGESVTEEVPPEREAAPQETAPAESQTESEAAPPETAPAESQTESDGSTAAGQTESNDASDDNSSGGSTPDASATEADETASEGA